MSSLLTPSQENISRTFVDARNTVWISTKDAIFYKLATENNFQQLALPKNLLTRLTSSNFHNESTAPMINFVKTNYSQDPTFYIYFSCLGLVGFSAPIIKINYQNNQLSVTLYDLSSKISDITSLWADDRGLLVAGIDKISLTPTLYKSDASDLNSLTKTVQPTSQAFANYRWVSTMFRADKNSELKNTIVIATSDVNPNAEIISFDEAQGTLISATDLEGSSFTQLIDTKYKFGSGMAFNDVLISKYPETKKTAYIMTGASDGLENSTSAVDIYLDPNNKTSLAIENTWAENLHAPFQTKSFASVNDYVFMFAKDAFSTSYTELQTFKLSRQANATTPEQAANPDVLNIKNGDFDNELDRLEASTSEPFYYMPTFATDNSGNLIFGVGDVLMYLGSLPSPIVDNKANNNNLTLILAITGTVVGVAGVGSFTTWYFLKKQKNKKANKTT